jgi:hypothetical protein
MSRSVISGLADAEDYDFATQENISEEEDKEEEEDEEGSVEDEVPEEWKKSKARDYLLVLYMGLTKPPQSNFNPGATDRQGPRTVVRGLVQISNFIAKKVEMYQFYGGPCRNLKSTENSIVHVELVPSPVEI